MAATYKARWAAGSIEEKRKLILFALRRGKTIQALAGLLDAKLIEVETYIVLMRDDGLIACTNKLWYRKDIPLKPPSARPPRPQTDAELKFTARQGKLF